MEGIATILEQFDNHYQVIQEMFASTADFGLAVLVILDNHMQKFFEMVSDPRGHDQGVFSPEGLPVELSQRVP